jgi:FMN phosphatase YigB (HAD superfamily)
MKKWILCLFGSSILLNSYAAPSADGPKTVIIFFNTLFRPHEKKMEEHVRKKLGIWYGLRLFIAGIPTPEEVRHELFYILHEIPLLNNLSVPQEAWQTRFVPWEKSHPFPPVLNQQLTASTASDENKLYHHVQNYLYNKSNIQKTHRFILLAVTDFLFQANHMNPILEPIPSMIHLVRNLKQHNYQIILAAAVPGYAWDRFVFQPRLHIIQELFPPDQCYVSGKLHLLPTSPAFFNLILEEQNLKPADCIVIAQHYHDLDYPRSIGMKTITVLRQKEINDFIRAIEKGDINF